MLSQIGVSIPESSGGFAQQQFSQTALPGNALGGLLQQQQQQAAYVPQPSSLSLALGADGSAGFLEPAVALPDGNRHQIAEVS